MNTAKFVLASLVFFAPAIVFGQKGERVGEAQSYGIFQTQEEYYQFMGTVKQEGNNDPELMAMVPMINDIVLERPIGSTSQQYKTEGSTLDLLANPEVRKDLEMVETQFEELRNSNDEIQKRAADQIRSLDFSDANNLIDRIREIRNQSEQELQATLLPHQMERLRQIAAQSQLRRRSLVEILTSEPIKTRLDITDNQSDELKDAEREIREDLEQQILKLREQAQKRLLAKLKPEQREKAEQIFGEAFEFQSAKDITGQSRTPRQR